MSRTIVLGARRLVGGAEHVSRVPTRQARRGLVGFWRLVGSTLLVGSVAAALAATPLILAGYRPLVVLSGSMAPAIETGDVVVTRLVGPEHVRVGDVVTFSDATRGGRLVTHRVVEKARSDDGYRFVTKGDANTGSEGWSIGTEGRLGRMSFRIPRIGYVVGMLSGPSARTVLVALVLVALVIPYIRRIWCT